MEDEQTATQLDAELNDGVAEEPQEEADQQDGDLGDAAADDAEGEDNEGEQQNQYEEDGFIVDELSGDEEDKPSKMRSRLKKKKEKKRKRVLEEEDYELMQENLGYKVPRPKLSKQEKNLAPVVEQPATENGDEDAGNKAEALGRLLFDGTPTFDFQITLSNLSLSDSSLFFIPAHRNNPITFSLLSSPLNVASQSEIHNFCVVFR